MTTTEVSESGQLVVRTGEDVGGRQGGGGTRKTPSMDGVLGRLIRDAGLTLELFDAVAVGTDFVGERIQSALDTA